MALQVYNTLTRRKEEFKPLTPPKVGMYVCGVTVYDDCHLGHARALVNFDVIYRYLKQAGYDVTYVRNFTDVDDKIIDRAQKEKVSWNEISKKYIEAFNRDVNQLGLLAPTFEPLATENILQITTLIKTLVANGYAYQAGSDVFYSVRKKQDYGKLSGKKIDELESGARIEIHETKKDPLDFALWKGSKPGEPAWDSPWGQGRPGWHIECSAMSMRYLGETFDIHGGGRDLSFPHHENEIAQSEGATGKEFARYWLHNGFVNINAEKMSKSLGNFLTLHMLLQQYPAEVIRLFILSAHYRSPLDYTEQIMQATKQSLNRWYTTMARIEKGGSQSPAAKEQEILKILQTKISSLDEGFYEAMNDDFNTAKIIGILFDLAREWNRVLDEQGAFPGTLYWEFSEKVRAIHGVLGLFGSEPKKYLEQEKLLALKKSAMTSQEIESKILARKEAKQKKDFKLADSIRNELLQAGIKLKDNPDGTTNWST